MYLKIVTYCFFLISLHLPNTWVEMALLTRASSATNSANSENSSNIDIIMNIAESLTQENITHRNYRSAALEGGLLLDDEDETDESIEDEENTNSTEPGVFLGGWCIDSCSSELDHAYCDPIKRICACEKKYPVRLGRGKGCAMPKLLGDQCFYTQTCTYYDTNAMCAQMGHNAMCACKPGFHSVGLQKGVKRMFCSEDIVLLHTDLPSLLVVASGIAVLSGLLCFVLRLFSSNRFGERGHYANANLAPPLLFSSDNQWINGIPLTVHGRPSSRSSSQRSTANLTQYRSKGVLVPASRAGAARAAAILLIPCHLQSARTPDAVPSSNEDDLESPKGSRRPSISSIRSNASSNLSYSQRRYDQENHQREQRAVMRLAREEAAKAAAPPTPSPMSTDKLLPSCEELNEDDPLGITSLAIGNQLATTPEVKSLNQFTDTNAALKS